MSYASNLTVPAYTRAEKEISKNFRLWAEQHSATKKLMVLNWIINHENFDLLSDAQKDVYKKDMADAEDKVLELFN